MATSFRTAIKKLLKAADQAKTPDAKGKACEDLAGYLFESIPGISISHRNALNVFESEEIDVAFWNEGDPDGLRLFDLILLVECKNWTARAGYPELALFNDKLRSRGRPLGIFVSAAGITGDPASRTAAHEVLNGALREGREIIVMTRREIEDLGDTDELVLLLKKKRAQLAVSGTIFQQ